MTPLKRLALLMPLVLSCALLLSSPAHAHNRSQSFSSWQIDGNHVHLLFTLKSREVTRLPTDQGESLEQLLVEHLQANVAVASNNQPCLQVTPFNALSANPGYLRASTTFDCSSGEPPEAQEQSSPVTLRIDSFFQQAPSHVHYARVALDKQPAVEYLFTDSVREQRINNTVMTWNRSVYHSAAQYTGLGVSHIFGGVDHIVFLLSLLLLLRTVRSVVLMVTGFTLGHSISLSLAVMGWVIPDTLVIEALIGFTIAAVSAENIAATTGAGRKIAYSFALGLCLMLLLSIFVGLGLTPITLIGLMIFTLTYLPLAKNSAASAAMRPLLTVAFGVIHGFGFASVLLDMGLPANERWPALLGFNIGVEIGQLLIVTGIAAVAFWLRKAVRVTQAPIIFDLSSALLCGIGLYWFISRSYAAL